MSRSVALVAGCALFISLSLTEALAQFGRGGGTWNTAGANAQRDSWARTDNRISATSMPGFAFLWKVKANNNAVQSYSLSSAVMVDSYIGYRGFRSYAFLGGASNNAVALDTDLGRVEWTKNFGPVASSASAACPGAMTAGVTRPTPLAPSTAAAGGRGQGGGRGGAASGVSEPGAGAITIGQGRGGGFGGGGGRGASGGRGPAAFGAAGGRGASGRGPGGFTRPPEAVYAVSTDGMLRTLYISNGEDAKPPVRFLPAGANASGLLLVNNVIYASTSGNCNGVSNGVWMIDTEEAGAAPLHWASNGGGVAGTYGVALGTDGTVYAGTADGDYSPTSFSDSLVGLDAKTLKLKDWFTPGKSAFTSSPVVFEDKGKDLIAVANQNGHIYLLDSAALGGADHKTPLSSYQYASSGADAGGLASWQDAAGTRWVLAASGNSIVALKVVDQNGKPTLQAGWVSPAIDAPLPPIVINGYVFTAASGAGSKPAVFYALDGATGKVMFNSGSTITAPASRSGALSGSAGQIYLATADNTIYAFGIPLVPPDLAKKVQ